MPRGLSIGLAVVLFLLPVSGISADNIAVVSPDGPPPSIVSTELLADQDAAKDLSDYLGRVTGKTIAPVSVPAENGVVIHVGRDQFVRDHAPEIENLFADGFVIKVVAEAGRQHLILAGKQNVAATWAVEQFLEEICGVRFLFPDPKYGEVVPSTPTVTIDSEYNKTFNPHYVSRYATSKAGNAYYTPSKRNLRGKAKWYGYGEHAIQFLFSEPEFKAHPEWFAFFNGKRQWWSYGNGWQICTSNPETVEHAAKAAIDFFDKNPDVPVFSVGLNDGMGWCECPECQKFVNSFSPAYTKSDLWFDWVNQVARKVAIKYPDKWIESMAYAVVSAPPRFKMEPNVAVTVTIVLPDNLKEAEEWTKICKSVNLYSYMYGGSFLGFRHYPHAAKDFLKWGHEKLGALAHISEAGGEWTFDGPKYAYINALQWNVDTDVDAFMKDYCEKSYGAAAKAMKGFWDRLEAIYERRDAKERQAFYVWVGWQQAFNVMPNHELKDYTEQDVQELDQLIEEAAKAASTEADRFRVERMADAWKYFRTSVLSYLRFTNQSLPQKIGSEAELEKATRLITEIAQLRADRNTMLSRMKLYPHLNPNAASSSYWGSFTGMTLFNRELTLLDAAASQITAYFGDNGKAAESYWSRFSSQDPLFETAQSQLKRPHDNKAHNLLPNGGFESSDVSDWQADGGQLAIASDKARTGKRSVRLSGSGEVGLSHKIQTRDREQYRLTAWCKPEGKVPDVPATIDSIIEFYGNGQRLWHTEPVRNVPYAESNGWRRVQSTFDVPPGANTAVIKLRKLYDGGSVLWDDLSLVRLQEGVEPTSTLVDDFTSPAIKSDTWFGAIASGGEMPDVKDGAVILRKDSVPLLSYATFPGLLHNGRLQFKLGTVVPSGQSTYVKLGVQSGMSAVGTTEGTGIWLMLEFVKPGGSDRLLMYAHQDGKVAASQAIELPSQAAGGENRVFTMIVDQQKVSLYRSAGENTTGDSPILQLQHGLTDIAVNGLPRLKLEGNDVAVDSIQADSPKGPEAGKGDDAKGDPNDPSRLIIPGGVAK